MYMYMHVYYSITAYRQEVAGFGQMMWASEKQKVNVIDESNSYAVFVSYIEIYNSYIYDWYWCRDTPKVSQLLKMDVVLKFLILNNYNFQIFKQLHVLVTTLCVFWC